MKPATEVTSEMLAGLIPLGDMQEKSLRDLARRAQILDRGAGEYLFQAGERSNQVLYLLEGSLRSQTSGGELIEILKAGSEAARHGISTRKQRRAAVICVTDVRCICIDGHILDVLLTWDQTTALEVGELCQGGLVSDDWMSRLLQTATFQQVPPANLQAIFMRMKQIDVEPGAVIVQQGDPGEYFYVQISGRSAVTREQKGRVPLTLAELDAGSCFGEESLISDFPRSATVTALSRCTLMRLAKQDFRTLLEEPLTKRISLLKAQREIEKAGAQILDVRLQTEFSGHHLPLSLNVPLYMLRMRLGKLDNKLHYICVCDTGRRSAVAAFILTQGGFRASVLQGGLEPTKTP